MHTLFLFLKNVYKCETKIIYLNESIITKTLVTKLMYFFKKQQHPTFSLEEKKSLLSNILLQRWEFLCRRNGNEAKME